MLAKLATWQDIPVSIQRIFIASAVNAAIAVIVTVAVR